MHDFSTVHQHLQGVQNEPHGLCKRQTHEKAMAVLGWAPMAPQYADGNHKVLCRLLGRHRSGIMYHLLNLAKVGWTLSYVLHG